MKETFFFFNNPSPQQQKKKIHSLFLGKNTTVKQIGTDTNVLCVRVRLLAGQQLYYYRTGIFLILRYILHIKNEFRIVYVTEFNNTEHLIRLFVFSSDFQESTLFYTEFSSDEWLKTYPVKCAFIVGMVIFTTVNDKYMF